MYCPVTKWYFYYNIDKDIYDNYLKDTPPFPINSPS